MVIQSKKYHNPGCPMPTETIGLPFATNVSCATNTIRMPLNGTCCRYEALHYQHTCAWVSSMVCIYVSCPRSYVTTDGSYSMVWLSICSILSSHSRVSIMYHVLARTSRQMGELQHGLALFQFVCIVLNTHTNIHNRTLWYDLHSVRRGGGFGTPASHDCVSGGYCLYIAVIGFVTRNITIVIC